MVDIREAPETITMTPGESVMSIGLGQTVTFEAAMPVSAASALTWSSTHPELADVDTACFDTVQDTKAVVTGLTEGATTITVRAFNNVKASCIVIVRAAPTEMTLDKTEIEMGVGERCELKPRFNTGAASWQTAMISTDTDIVAVENGLLVAKQQGTAVVRLQTYNGLTASCTVTVKAAPESLTLSKTVKKLGVNESYTLEAVLSDDSASKITWKTNNSDAVTVVGGRLKAVAAGKAVITAETFNGLAARCTVTVMEAPTELSLTRTSVTIRVGESVPIRAILSENSASTITWTTSQPDVAEVVTGLRPSGSSATGYVSTEQEIYALITGKQEGTSTIYARTFNGMKVGCTVIVKSSDQTT